MNTVELIKSLSEAFGPAGFEDGVREVIRGKIEPLVDEMGVDPLGNLIAWRRGNSDKRILLDAHMDEIGFMIRHIGDNGFVRVTPLGGWDNRNLLTHRVRFGTRDGRKITGVFGAKPPHISSSQERNRVIELEDMFVDVGASSREEAEKMGLNIGDPAVIEYPFEDLGNGVLLGKAFDDRAGCAVIIAVLEALKGTDLPFTLVCAFTVCEEVGLRGARTAAHGVKPDLAIALEGTIGADMPGVPDEKRPTSLGKGPAISVADKSIIVNRRLVQEIENAARSVGVPFQYKMPSYGGTDAGSIHTSRRGVLTGVVSVPCRYIHSPSSMLRVDDFENTVALVSRLVMDSDKIYESCVPK